MGWFTRLLGIEQAAQLGAEVRALQVDDVYGAEWSPDSIMSVTDENALRLVPVYSATGLIADMYAQTPVLFGEAGEVTGTRTPAPPWWTRPDPRVSLFDWKHQLLTALLLRGNAYGLIVRDVFGAVQHVLWIPPHMVHVDETQPMVPVYRLEGSPREHINVAQGGDILHIPAYVVAGTVVGLSPVGLFRRQFEMSRSALLVGYDFYRNRAMPAGILKSDTLVLDPKATDEAKQQFLTSVKSGVVAFDKNWTWQQVTLDPADAAFLDTIEASANQIAAMYRVEPEDVGGKPTNSLKYSTVEGNQRKFNTRTLGSWTSRIEAAFTGTVLRPGQTMHHNLDALSRPNLLEYTRAITEQLRNGTLTLAEARRELGRSPLSETEIEQWLEWFATLRSESSSESSATSVALDPSTANGA